MLNNNKGFVIVHGFGATAPAPPVPLLTITASSPLPVATVGSAYSDTISVTGGVLPYTWSITADTPDSGNWLLINSTTGLLSGTPGTAETESVTIKVTDNVGTTATKTFSLTVNSTPAPTITTSSPLTSGTVGSAYSTTIAATSGVLPYTWSIISDTPNTGNWLSINSSSGVLSGTPGTAEVESVTIKVTDHVGSTATKTFSLTVASNGGGTTKTLAGHWIFGSYIAGITGSFSGSASTIVSAITSDISNSFSGTNGNSIAGYMFAIVAAQIETSQGVYGGLASILDPVRQYMATNFPTKGLSFRIWWYDIFQPDPSRCTPGYILSSSTYGSGYNSNQYGDGNWEINYGGPGSMAAYWRSAVMNRINAMASGIASHVWSGSANTNNYTYDQDPNFRAICMLEESSVAPATPLPSDSEYSIGGYNTLWVSALTSMAGSFPNTPVLDPDNWGLLGSGASDAIPRINGAAAIPGVWYSGPDIFIPQSDWTLGQLAYTGTTSGSTDQRSNMKCAPAIETGSQLPGEDPGVDSSVTLAKLFATCQTFGAHAIFWQPGYTSGGTQYGYTVTQIQNFAAANPIS